MTYYKCEKCDTLCDLVAVDNGNYEEVWGARMWIPVWEDVSDCCHAECEEISEEEAENDPDNM